MLNQGQQAAYEKLLVFLESENTDKKVYLLKGYAGVGKTYLLRELLKNVSGTTLVAAPTNKAVKVLKHRLTGLDCQIATIYSLLGLKLQISPKGEKKFVRDYGKEDCIQEGAILVIDEAGMLDEYISELLMVYVNNLGIKLILVGDEAQIPPVEGKKDYALPFLQDFQTENNIQTISLTEIMRQENGSGIIDLATHIRDNLYSKDVLNTDIMSREGIEVLNSSLNHLLEKLFKQAEFYANSDYAKVIAWTNKCVDSVNRIIRKILYEDKSTNFICVGEKLIMDEPLSINGLVIYPTSEELTVKNYTRKTRHILGVELNYCEITVEEEVKGHYLEVLHPESYEAWAELLAEKKEEAKQYKTREMWAQYYKLDSTFAKVKYNYAVTAHKAQGSTYSNVVVMAFDILKNNRVLEANRILYTAITRASKKVFICE